MLLKLPQDVGNIPKIAGVYLFYNVDMKPLYIGKSKNLYKRIVQHLPSMDRFPWGKWKPNLYFDNYIERACFIRIIKAPENKLDDIEKCLIIFFKPIFNKMGRVIE